MKKFLDLKFLSIIFLLYSSLITIQLYIYPGELNTISRYDASILAYLFGILFAPITEEFIFRYWAYGKNIKLQFSLFIAFVIYMIIDLVQNFIFEILYISNNFEINIIFRNSLVIAFGLVFYYFIKKYNLNIPAFFYKLIYSRFTFYFIVILFEAVHWYHTDFNYNYLPSYILGFFASYLITRHARDYGIYFSILFHIVNNTIGTLAEAIDIRTESKNYVTNQLLFNYSIIALFCTSLYLIEFLRAKPLTLNQR